MAQNAVRATVQYVDLNGRHGPYATATTKKVKGTITFSLDDDVWHENTVPQNGMIVVLSDLHKRSRGWRAMSARLLTPSDECQSAMQQTQKGLPQ